MSSTDLNIVLFIRLVLLVVVADLVLTLSPLVLENLGLCRKRFGLFWQDLRW